MITPTQMYWLTRLSNIQCLLMLVLVGLLFTGVAAIIAFGVNHGLDDDFCLSAKRFAFRCFTLATMIGAISALLPTTKEMAAILVVPRIVNSEKIQTAGNKLYDLAVEWMDELKPRKNGAKEAH